MTAAEFLEQWQEFNESPNFVRYQQGLMASIGVTEADQLFLIKAGLLARMQAIDPVAFSDDNYWPWHFSMLHTPT